MSAYDPAIHHRRSIRLKGHDYAAGGLYFVTTCAHREFIHLAKGHPFCERATCVSPVREIIEEEWKRSGELRDDVLGGEFVVMPDHVHGLIRIEEGRSELGHVIGAFKAAASRRIRGVGGTPLSRDIRIWHRNYYERIVRTAQAARNIREYIRMNPWKLVQHASLEGQTYRMIGNPALLNREKIAVLCSRRCPPDVLKTAEEHARAAGPEHCFVSGFHSPPEKAILAALLQSGGGLICCPAWGIDTMRIPLEWLPALETNRMLILETRKGDTHVAPSSGGDTHVAPSLASAEERNRFVLGCAEKRWLPYVSSGGMLARLVDSAAAKAISPP